MHLLKLDALELLVIGLSQHQQTLLDRVNLINIALVLLRQIKVVLLLIDVYQSLHEKLLCEPLRRLFKRGFHEFQPQVKQVSKLVVLKNVYQSLAFVGVLHHTKESVGGFLGFLSVCNAKIE